MRQYKFPGNSARLQFFLPAPEEMPTGCRVVLLAVFWVWAYLWVGFHGGDWIKGGLGVCLGVGGPYGLNSILMDIKCQSRVYS